MKYIKIDDIQDSSIYMKVSSENKREDFITVSGCSIFLFEDNDLSLVHNDKQTVFPIHPITKEEYDNKLQEAIKIIQNEIQK